MDGIVSDKEGVVNVNRAHFQTISALWSCGVIASLENCSPFFLKRIIIRRARAKLQFAVGALSTPYLIAKQYDVERSYSLRYRSSINPQLSFIHPAPPSTFRFPSNQSSIEQTHSGSSSPLTEVLNEERCVSEASLVQSSPASRCNPPLAFLSSVLPRTKEEPAIVQDSCNGDTAYHRLNRKLTIQETSRRLLYVSVVGFDYQLRGRLWARASFGVIRLSP